MGMKVIKPKEFPKYMTTKTNYGKIMINLNPKIKHESKKHKHKMCKIKIPIKF
jgi:hypothetical protein